MFTNPKRSWKLQEFTAHGANVNCLALGHKSGRVLVTGGDDKKVNLWAIGKQNCIMSLTDHTTSVECVKFGRTEDLVCAGSQAGVLKVWDLEAAKLVRTLVGHRSMIKCIDFHPYGDFLSSGSLDTSIKLWDTRRKGCIFTYKGHEQTVNSIKFSPDGQWIASGDEEGSVKIWDLRVGRVLNELNKHSGAITDVEFHPHEFLLASSSADRSVYLWDVETFQLVSKSEKEASIIRCLHFSVGGECLFGGCAEQLKVFGWEPSRIYDTVTVGWSKIQDIATTQNQLVGASFYLSDVLVCVVDLKQVSPFGPSPFQTVTKPQENFVRDNVIRKSFNKQNSNPESKLKMDVKPIEESETEPEDESALFIPNVNDYKAIFSPQRSLNRSPPLHNQTVSPPSSIPVTINQATFCQTMFTQNSLYSSRKVSQISLSPPLSRIPPPVNLNPVPINHTPPSSPSPPLPNQNIPPNQSPPHKILLNESPLGNIPLNESPPRNILLNESPPRTTIANMNTNKQSTSNQFHDLESVHSSDSDMILTSSGSTNGLTVDEFLPANFKHSSYGRTNSDITENEALSTISRGHDSMVAVLKSRQKGLEVVYSLWHNKDLKCAMEEAVAMNNLAIITDILSVFNGKPSLWNLDVCGILLPAIHDLLQSKYEIYMSVGCDSLRLILRNFSSVIKTNTMWSGSTIGVDISKEERYNKCMKCYNILVKIRTFLLKRQTLQGKLGQSFRELLTKLQEFDGS